MYPVDDIMLIGRRHADKRHINMLYPLVVKIIQDCGKSFRGEFVEIGYVMFIYDKCHEESKLMKGGKLVVLPILHKLHG